MLIAEGSAQQSDDEGRHLVGWASANAACAITVPCVAIPAIEDTKTAVNTQLRPALVWAKTKSEDGTSFSVLLKPQVYSETREDQGRSSTDRPCRSCKPPDQNDGRPADALPADGRAHRHDGFRAARRAIRTTI